MRNLGEKNVGACLYSPIQTLQAGKTKTELIKASCKLAAFEQVRLSVISNKTVKTVRVHQNKRTAKKTHIQFNRKIQMKSKSFNHLIDQHLYTSNQRLNCYHNFCNDF